MVWAVVVAAGRGERAGFGKNKVFVRITGKTLLSVTLQALAESNAFDGIVVVLNKCDYEEYQKTVLSEYQSSVPLIHAWGGSTRTESVYSGICAVPEGTRIVAIHDAARPYVSKAIIDATIESAQEYGSGVISTPVIDTIKQVGDGEFVIHTPDRNSLRAVQTPQTFRYDEIMRAHIRAAEEGTAATDDAALYERYIGNVRLVTTDDAARNIKLTMHEDFERAEGKKKVDRIGMGYDAHRLVEGRKLILCGVEVPYEKGLLGHSDADVAVHALMDALLGAAAMGDIGKLFPDTDPAYKGINSMLLLNEVCERIREAGYTINNLDITIVAQRPKLSPYHDQMIDCVSSVMKLAKDQVSIKATTTEKMGYEGRGEGISAQAIVLLSK